MRSTGVIFGGGVVAGCFGGLTVVGAAVVAGAVVSLEGASLVVEEPAAELDDETASCVVDLPLDSTTTIAITIAIRSPARPINQ
jgi:hypothetical protein